MSIVRLNVQKASRRESLASALGKEHEVWLGDSGGTQDRRENLLILDHTTLQQSGVGALSKYKGDDPRPESPILLLVPSARKSDLSSPVWKKIDDVIEIPVRWPEMKGRVDVLIRMQEIAGEEESFRQMAARYRLMLEKQQRQLEGYTALFKNSPLGALVFREGEVVEATLRAEELLGTKDLLGRTLGALSPDQQPGGKNSEVEAKDLLNLAEGETKETEWMFKGPEEETFLSPVVLTSVEFGGEPCAYVRFSEGSAGTPSVFS